VSSAHTPGPWYLKDDGGVLQVSDSREHTKASAVVHWCGFNFGDKRRTVKRANARLIAAAPDLLAALEDFIDLIDRSTKTHSFVQLCSPLAQKTADKMRDAIAKATP